MKFNEAFFQELSRSPEVTDLVKSAAEKIADTAKATAPVGSGDYRDSIHVEMKQQRRSVALVVADDPKSLLIEAKTGNLLRALRAARKRRG